MGFALSITVDGLFDCLSIILDEIHTIGQQEGGAVWEQIILLVVKTLGVLRPHGTLKT